MPADESASAVYAGLLQDTPAGDIAVWVTRNGVRRIGTVTPEMIEDGHWDDEGHATLRVALLAIEGVSVDGFQSRSRVHPEVLQLPL